MPSNELKYHFEIEGLRLSEQEVTSLSHAINQLQASIGQLNATGLKGVFESVGKIRLTTAEALKAVGQVQQQQIVAATKKNSPEDTRRQGNFEGIEDLSRRRLLRGSQDMIDKAAQVAMADFKENFQRSKNFESLQGLARQGSSESRIGEQAAIAAGDAKTNVELEAKRLKLVQDRAKAEEHVAAIRQKYNNDERAGKFTPPTPPIIPPPKIGLPDEGGGGPLKGLGSLVGKFYLIHQAISVMKEAFRAFVASIKEAFEYGAKLFIRSAQLGTNSGKLFAARQAGNAVGLSDEQTDRLALRLQSGRSSHGKGSLEQFGELRQLGALADTFKEVFKDAQQAAETMRRTSAEFFTVSVAVTKTQTTLKEFWALLAEGSSGVVKTAAEDIKDFFNTINKSGITAAIGRQLGASLLILEKAFTAIGIVVDVVLLGLVNQMDLFATALSKLKDVFYVLTGNDLGTVGKAIDGVKDFADNASGELVKGLKKSVKSLLTKNDLIAPESKDGGKKSPLAALPAGGQWERLGLSFGGTGLSNDYARQTADNTRKIAEHLAKPQQHITPSHRNLLTNAP